LGDTAGDRHHRVAAVRLACFFGQAHAAELGIDLLGRLLADMAGVEDNQVGVVHGLGQLETGRRKRFGHALGIVRIHLAAEGFDVELFGAHRHLPFVGPEGPVRQVFTVTVPASWRSTWAACGPA
jgi:hypothetical protein